MSLTKANFRMVDGTAVNAKDWGAVGDGVADDQIALQAGYDYAVANGLDFYMPAGSYRCVAGRVIWGDPSPTPDTTLTDLNNVTVFGDGRATLLWTDTVGGADVVNVNNSRNATFRDFAITANVSGDTFGSNGVSVSGGFDNLNFFDLYVFDLDYLDEPTHQDGGKAFSIQSGTAAVERGTINCRMQAKGCVYGAGVDQDNTSWSLNNHAIDINMTVEDCYRGFVWGGINDGVLTAGITTGVRMRGIAVNCQKSVSLVRAHGIDVDVIIVTNKTAAARRLNPKGAAWRFDDAIVDGFYCAYAKDSTIRVNGDCGDADWKAQIGGWTVNSSGLDGTTDNCVIDLNLGGATVGDLNLIETTGWRIKDTLLKFGKNFTASPLDPLLYAVADGNTVITGDLQHHLQKLHVGDKLVFPNPNDGVAENYTIEVLNDELSVRAQNGVTNFLNIMRWLDNSGDEVFGVTQDGGLTVTGVNSSNVSGGVVKAIQCFDTSHNIIGYIPIHLTNTP